MTHTLQSLPTPLPFLARPLVAAIIAAFREADVDVRFVGGCVRDTLLRQATKKMDIDLATPAVPDEVTKILQKAGITVKPTGLAFGTVTAVGHDDHVEITTLRRDLSSDGRHAVVEFGTSWEEDAARRDFTINALYADADGTITDYHGGMDDLQSGLVRFIGAPLDRIREDYLRILRFFRFHARFATGEIDPEALGACAALKGEVENLSAERVWMELGKLLAQPTPQKGIGPMALAGVLDKLLPYPYDIDRLEAYALAESHHDYPAVPVLRLAALFPNAGDALVAKLKLSGREAAWLDLVEEALAVENQAQLARAFYWHKDTIMKARGWLPNLAFLYTAVHPDQDADGIITFAAAWEAPVFPLKGADMIALGVESGPRMGEILDEIEKWWAAENFTPTYEACYKRAEAYIRTAAE